MIGMYRAETVWLEGNPDGEGKFMDVSWGETDKVASERGFAYVPVGADLLYQKTTFHETIVHSSDEGELVVPLVRKGY